jgi:hypothetical protein
MPDGEQGSNNKQNFNISEDYFQECFQVNVRGAHVANVFYTPSKHEKKESRIFEAGHGYGGSPWEFCRRAAM